LGGITLSKKRNFSVFLLKEGYNENNALKDDHNLQKCIDANRLPEKSILYIMDSVPKPPWWKNYFGVSDDLFQSLKSAILFVPTEERCFAFTFGHSRHSLKDTSYEYDFGLIITLNCLDPEKLQSTDILEPGIARRQRIQTPVDSSLTYFDFDSNSDIIKKLTGKVKSEYFELFDKITGAESLHISINRQPNELPELCAKLLQLYSKEDYKTEFPDIHNIRPVKDPEKVQELNLQLLEAIKEKNEKILLTIPDIVDYEKIAKIVFLHNSKRNDKKLQDASMDTFYEFLVDNEFKLQEIDEIKTLKESYHMQLEDENGVSLKKFNILKCLLFDVETENKQTYHFCEGNWYIVNKNYLEKIQNNLDPYFEHNSLTSYSSIHKDLNGKNCEAKYNKDVAKRIDAICLDKTTIHPNGQTQVEPCDIYEVKDNTSVFYHVKRFTDSKSCSHHFNQGVNSIELLMLEPESSRKMEQLIRDNNETNQNLENLLKPLRDKKNYKVIYAIITAKDINNKSENLPLFSRISLMRCLNSLKLMKVEAAYTYIEDTTKIKETKSKQSKQQKKSKTKKSKKIS
jgi:uncharacterized protein (TIGR04141 family)